MVDLRKCEDEKSKQHWAFVEATSNIVRRWPRWKVAAAGLCPLCERGAGSRRRKGRSGLLSAAGSISQEDTVRDADDSYHQSKETKMSDLTDVPAERFNSPEHQEWLADRKRQPPCNPQPIKPKRKAHRCPECDCAAGRHTNVCSQSKANRGCGAPCESPCTCAAEEDRRYKAFGK